MMTYIRIVSVLVVALFCVGCGGYRPVIVEDIQAHAEFHPVHMPDWDRSAKFVGSWGIATTTAGEAGGHGFVTTTSLANGCGLSSSVTVAPVSDSERPNFSGAVNLGERTVLLYSVGSEGLMAVSVEPSGRSEVLWEANAGNRARILRGESDDQFFIVSCSRVYRFGAGGSVDEFDNAGGHLKVEAVGSDLFFFGETEVQGLNMTGGFDHLLVGRYRRKVLQTSRCGEGALVSGMIGPPLRPYLAYYSGESWQGDPGPKYRWKEGPWLLRSVGKEAVLYQPDGGPLIVSDGHRFVSLRWDTPTDSYRVINNDRGPEIYVVTSSGYWMLRPCQGDAWTGRQPVP